MEQYISKSVLVAEIERLKERFTAFHHRDGHDWPLDNYGKMRAYNEILSFLDTLEVKEIHEDIDLDLNPIFEEFDIDPDSRFASMFKEGFYKGIDRYLNKKENKL